MKPRYRYVAYLPPLKAEMKCGCPMCCAQKGSSFSVTSPDGIAYIAINDGRSGVFICKPQEQSNGIA